MVEKKPIGKITHFFTKVGVAVVELSDDLSVEERISIEGPNTHIEQSVESMQIEKKDIQHAERGQAIGLKVNGQVREKDVVYKLQ